MPTQTYKPLATITLASASGSVVFNSIPNTFRDLILVFDGSCITGGNDMVLRFNSDTSNSYTGVRLSGNGSASSSSTFNTTFMRVGFISTSRTNAVIQILDSSATDKHKRLISRSNIPSGSLDANSGRWANAVSITSITCLNTSFNYAAGSTFSLYGIEA